MTWSLPGGGDTSENAAATSDGSSPSVRAASAASNALSTLMAPVRGVETRCPRHVNCGVTRLQARCRWRHCDAPPPSGFAPSEGAVWPQGSSALTTPRKAWSDVKSELFASKYASIVPW